MRLTASNVGPGCPSGTQPGPDVPHDGDGEYYISTNCVDFFPRDQGISNTAADKLSKWEYTVWHLEEHVPLVFLNGLIADVVRESKILEPYIPQVPLGECSPNIITSLQGDHSQYDEECKNGPSYDGLVEYDLKEQSWIKEEVQEVVPTYEEGCQNLTKVQEIIKAFFSSIYHKGSSK